MNVKFRKLGWLEWWWLRVFIAPTIITTVAVDRHTGQDTAHCPVLATSVDRWGLEWLTAEVLCPLAAPDNPVHSDFAGLTYDVCTIHFYCSPQSTVERG
jgi:hypothetical protein